MPTLDELIQKIQRLQQLIQQNLAPRITNIENYLSTLNERVQNGSVIVTGAFTMEKITPLDISESDLIEVYNNVPKVLLKNSIIAELTAKSYREDNQNQPVFLQKDEHGKYWIIVCNKNDIFLLPNIHIKFHIHKLKTVAKLFDFSGITPSVNSHFLVIKPAKLSSLPNGKEWKLEEKGILEFTDHISPASFRQQREVQENLVKSSLEKTYLVIENLKNQINELNLQMEQLQQKDSNESSNFEISDLQVDILEIKDNQGNAKLEIMKLNKQLNEVKAELEKFDRKHEDLTLDIKNLAVTRDYLSLQSPQKTVVNNPDISKIDEQISNLRSLLTNFQEDKKNLESRIGYVSIQIDLIKVRLESLESHEKNNEKN